MDEPNPILRLLKSSKALVAMLVIAASFVALLAGRATWDQVETLLKWVLPVWMGSQAAEDAAAKLAAPKLMAVKHNVAMATKASSDGTKVTSMVPPA